MELEFIWRGPGGCVSDEPPYVPIRITDHHAYMAWDGETTYVEITYEEVVV